MSKIYNKLEIEIQDKITDIITAVQEDSNSRYLDVVLLDDGLPLDLTGEEVRIYMKKPDGTEIFNNGEITDAENGRCQFLLTTQALAAVGVMDTQISVWKDNEEILTTQQFHIYVTESLRTNGSIESSNEYGALVVLFQNLYEAYDLMTDMIAQIGDTDDTGGSSTAGTVNAKLNQIQSQITNLDGDVANFQSLAAKETTLQNLSGRIGQTTDSSGTTTAGSVFAKLNATMGMWNQTRAGYVDNIYSYTQTSGTINRNGTLSQKLNFIIDNLTTGQTKQLKMAQVQGDTATIFNKTTTGILQAFVFRYASGGSDYVRLSITVDDMIIYSGRVSVNGNYSYCLVPNNAAYANSPPQLFVIGGVTENDGTVMPTMLNIPYKNSCKIEVTETSQYMRYWIYYSE